MNNSSTKLLNLISDTVEFARMSVERDINHLLQMELTAHLGYSKNSPESEYYSNSRNGGYSRVIKTAIGELNIFIPRDREGTFEQHTVPKYERSTPDIEEMVLTLYSGGMSDREISAFMDEKYNLYYSPTTISNMTKSLVNRAEEFHNRRLQKKYAVIYLDATFIPVRRDTSNKEALHVIVGVEPNGKREVLDAVLFPTEAAQNYEELLERLKERGVEQVLLFISDGLTGMRDAVKRVFPKAEHQSCWVHISRRVAAVVRVSDRAEVLGTLKKVYNARNAEEAEMLLDEFIQIYSKKYPSLKQMFLNRDSLFSFYEFPPDIYRHIYSSNIIEGSNSGLKLKTKSKLQFTTPDSLDRFVSDHYLKYNKKLQKHTFQGFRLAAPGIQNLFFQKYGMEAAM